MISDSTNIAENTGESNLPADSGKETGTDDKFRVSIKNLLLLTKDFYAADFTVVYWYNKAKNSFKLLSDSEEPGSGIHKEKFEAGDDILSAVCIRQQPQILFDVSGYDSLNHLENVRIRSLMAYPLLVDTEVIGVVMCESRSENFFGQPNLDTLKVFADSIVNYIKYYSLSEEFDFEDSLIKVLASGKFNDEPLFALIHMTLERFVEVEDYFVVICSNEEIIRASMLRKHGTGLDIEEIEIEQESLIYRAVKDRKIFNRYFRFGENTAIRYSCDEEKVINVNFCAIPLSLGSKCIGVLAFDTRDDINAIQHSLKKMYKLLYPVFLYLSAGHLTTGVSSEKENKVKIKKKSEFDARLKSELARCRQFDDYNVFIAATGIDKIESLLNAGYTSGELERLFINDLTEELNGYDQIYKIDGNRYHVLICADSEDRIHIEFEKIRKNISVKIHNIEGKEVTFTASFAIKRYLDLKISQEEFQKELDGMLKLSGTEGGNLVKI